jgi:hypothetical protein
MIFSRFFKVLVLVPVTFVVAVGVVAGCMLQSDNLITAGVNTLAICVALQLGYLLGAAVLPNRARPIRGGSQTVEFPHFTEKTRRRDNDVSSDTFIHRVH